MRALFICPQLPPRCNGCGDATDKIARRALAEGDEATVLTDDMPESPAPYRVRSVATWDIAAVRETTRFVRTYDPDAVLLQYTPFLYGPRSLYPYLLLRALRDRTVVVYAHEAFYRLKTQRAAALKTRYLWARDKATLNVARTIFVASEDRARAIAREVPASASRLRVVPFGANIEPLRSPEPRALPGVTLRMLAFGIVMPRRRIDLLVRAVRALHDIGIDAELRVAGRIQDPLYALQCEELAAQIGVARRFTFLNAVDPQALREEFARANVFLHAATEGAIPSAGSLLAALAHGVPTVAVRTQYDDPRFAAALAFADETPAAIAACVAGVAGGATTLSQRGAAARRLYDEEFGWNSFYAALRAAASARK